METYPPPSGDLLTPPQLETVRYIVDVLDENEFDQGKINPYLSDLVSEMKSACETIDDQCRMLDELERAVRWWRIQGYWLTFLLQLSLRELTSPYFVAACSLYSNAQINLNDDLLISSMENGYNALKYLSSLSDDQNEDLRKVTDDFLEQLRLIYQYHRQFYTSRHSYKEINPLSEHLYSVKTHIDLKMAFPHLKKPRAQLSTADYLKVIEQCKETENTYCCVVARRFLGSMHQGLGELDAACEQFRCGLEEAQSVSLETEIGHFHRLYGYALSQSGQLSEAALQFEQSIDFEREPIFSYWQALSLRELADVRMMISNSKADFADQVNDIKLASKVYSIGRFIFEANIGAGVVPVSRAVKQQLFRSYADNALQATMMLDNPRSTLAEFEAAGPRYATELVAESKAAGTLPSDIQDKFRQARSVFHQSLTTFDKNGSLDQDFARYIADVEGEREKRLLYLNTRNNLAVPVTHAQLSDEIAQKILALRLPKVVFLIFHIGQGKTFATLLDVSTGKLMAASIELGEQDYRIRHEEYREALQEAKGLPDPAVGMCRSLDDLLDFYEESLSPLLEAFLPLLKGAHLKIFPRLFMNEVPLHALNIGGKRLIEHCEVSYAQTLGLFLQVHETVHTSSNKQHAIISDEKGAPSYRGAINRLESTYGKSLRVMPNPLWQDFATFIRKSNPTDVFFACHGQYDPDDPAASSLKFSESEVVPFSKIFSELDLAACQCVTLGACESGLGRTIVTAEYVGLPIAFFAAGVRYVIGSLWRVNQFAAAILLSHHYELLHDEKHSIPEALNEAQRVVMRMTKDQVLSWIKTNLPDKTKSWTPIIQRMKSQPFAHPYYWAGFYIAGDV